ncbi:MAG: TIGR02466 family protein [Xanthomonadales bacterium]|nr:TIGR02466 family protein [Xanthomonadales bacterium]
MELKLDQERDVLALFRTPLARFALPNAEEINPGLEVAILDRRPRSTGMNRSNVRGWHSNRDFQKWPEPEAAELVDSMRSAVQNMVSLVSDASRFSARIEIVAWANVNGPGSYNHYHTHPNCLWSGVYYVRAGEYAQDDLKHAGKLKLYDPRGAVDHLAHPGRGFGRNVNIPPRTGTMVIFPAWLAHSVNSFDSDTLRISVAFNARVKDFQALD